MSQKYWIRHLRTGIAAGIGASVLVASAAKSVPTAKPKRAKSSQKSSTRSEEWKALPKQNWELVNLTVPPEVDKTGIDSRSRILFHQETGLDIRTWVAPEDFEPFGRIIGARNDASFLSLGDIVVIEKDSLDPETKVDWAIGQIYSIGGESVTFESGSGGRDAKVFPLLGRVRILGPDPSSNGERIFAQIVAAKDPVSRGSVILPSVERVHIDAPKASKEVLKAHVKLPPRSPVVSFTQTDLVLIDRGAEDGFEPGNVFRAYQSIDPNNKKKLTEGNQLISADLLVIQVSRYFSTALVMRSRGPLPDEFPVYSLTDVTDVQWKQEYLSPGVAPSPVDRDLGALDDKADQLSDSEKRELNQLETYKPPVVAAPGADATGTNTSPANASPPPPEAKTDAKPEANLDAELDGAPPAEPPPPADSGLPPPAPAEASPADAVDPELDN